ncbi:MAG: hypothetical protein R2795_06765 [Saprospiraceae bacterium]
MGSFIRTYLPIHLITQAHIFWPTVLTIASVWGISRITTNYNIINNMPRGEQITADFHFFERELTGFRPLACDIYPR